MRKGFLIELSAALVAILALTGCVKNNSSKTFTSDDVAPFISTEEYKVPVKAGYYAVVTCCGDTLAVTGAVLQDSTAVIWIPKSKVNNVTTKTSSSEGQVVSTVKTKDVTDSDGVVISYYPITASTYGGRAVNRYQLWQSIGFEDSKDIDYDYNDLVIHILTRVHNGQLHVGIHPIAYGAQKTIELGFTVYKNGAEVINQVVSSNCRADLFEGVTGTGGYINTKDYDHQYTDWYKIYTVPGSYGDLSGVEFVWWIIPSDTGEPIYAVNEKTAPSTLLNSSGMPYGVVCSYMSDGYDDGRNKGTKVGYNWFFYPKEGVSIWNYFQVSGGVFGYKSGVTGPDVNDFILKYTGSDSELKKNLYSFAGNTSI